MERISLTYCSSRWSGKIGYGQCSSYSNSPEVLVANLFQIVRMYHRDDVSDRVIRRNVSLSEAKQHCNDPETSSETCESPENQRHTEYYGPWFDGYEIQTTR